MDRTGVWLIFCRTKSADPVWANVYAVFERDYPDYPAAQAAMDRLQLSIDGPSTRIHIPAVLCGGRGEWRHDE